MFRRRKKPNIAKRLSNIVWPTIGIRRSWQYVRHRLGRLQGSPYAIAAGVAYGAAISFTPLLGGHIAIAILLSWISRASVVAAVIGTAVGNPWTFPFIWTWIYTFGDWMLGVDPLDFKTEGLSFSYLLEHFLEIFIPMLVGSIPTVAIVWIAFYYPIKASVERYQMARRIRIGRGGGRPGGLDEGDSGP